MKNSNESSETVDGELSLAERTATAALFFASGFAGLLYEVLWIRDLGLVFGNTTHAAATTLTAFFLGLVAGAAVWGRRAARTARPLRAYALLEAGVAAGAVLYLFLLDVYHASYETVFALLGGHPGGLVLAKLVLALLVLVPPSFFMGGSFPMMAEHVVRRPGTLGAAASRLYGLNTLGAAAGAYVAGFHLPPRLGYDGSYAVALATTLLVAIVAWLVGGADRPRTAPVRAASRPRGGDTLALGPQALLALAFFSGAASLGLEVLWTRMFAQVLLNSVHTFSAILVTFLLALALGARLAEALIRRGTAAGIVLPALLVASAVAVGATPFVFDAATGGLGYLGGHWGLGTHGAFGSTLLVLAVPGLLVGSVFPYLLRLAEPLDLGPGATVGRLAAVNTLGAVAGSLGAGFVLLELLGLWSSLRLVAVAYLVVGLFVAGRSSARTAPAFRTAAVVGLLLEVSLADPARLPLVRVDPVGRGEALLGVWEGPGGVVAVVREPGSLNLKLDNAYAVGGTGAAAHERRQGHLPLVLHPAPEAVFFLGMGTGITAGAALDHPVRRVVVAELSADVVEAARTFFRPYANGLFDDERVRIVVEDGRNVLFGSRETFDVIVADLFLPWKQGVGDLYSLDHYRNARRRLRPGGLYAQWVPLYQMSDEELGIVARTMVEAFPLVTLWRGILTPGFETALLVGHRDRAVLDPERLGTRLAASPPEAVREWTLPSAAAADGNDPVGGTDLRDLLLRYAANLSAARSSLARYPVNTDDCPRIAYEAAEHRLAAEAGGPSPWLVGDALLGWLAELRAAAPLESDPFLARLDPSLRAVAAAGDDLYRAKLLEARGDARGAFEALERVERASGAGGALEQERRELRALIERYERRLEDLRQRLREAEASGPP